MFKNQNIIKLLDSVLPNELIYIEKLFEYYKSWR